MTAAIIAAVLLLLLIVIRIGVTAEYSCNGFAADLNIAFFNIKIYPRPLKKKISKKNEKVPRNTAEKKEKPQLKKGGPLPDFWGIIELADKTFGRLRKKLLINRLIIHYTAGNEDPFDAVMAYGCVSGGINTIYPVLSNIFKIKKKEFYTSVDFNSRHTLVYVHIKLSLSLISVVYIGVMFLLDYFKIKKAENNGTNVNRSQKENDIETNRKADLNG